MDKKLLRMSEVIEATGLSRSEIYRAIERRELKVVKFGRAVRVTPADIDAFVETKRRQTEQEPVAV